MRTIKFRAWDKNKKRYATISNIPLMNNGGIQFEFTKLSQERFVLEQFTGRYDSNEGEIYEGDLVQYRSYEDWGDKVGIILTKEVFYNQNTAAFMLRFPGQDTSFYIGEHLISNSAFTPILTIVGNIHEQQ